jgi:predicted Rossmann fold flavoprotein
MAPILTQSIDVIVIGAGAAGLMCAIEAGKRGRSVVVLERNDAVGKKIRISGGGRCNFTNLHTTPENFISENPNFHKSALARYKPSDFIALVKRHRIAFHEKKLGQLFCDGSSQQIIDMLKGECASVKARIVLNCRVEAIQKRERFHLSTSAGEFDCASLVIATGGLSIPKLGATDFGYGVAKQFGLKVNPVRPALVGLVLEGLEANAFRDLHGVALDATVRSGRVEFRENILFTHRGVSGPAIIQISSYWKPGTPIIVDVLPDDKPAKALPRRFVQAWKTFHADEELRHWTLTPAGTEGYAKAEVTLGGVDTRELSSKTMEVIKVPGLYFIGEVVDVTGQLGGFNFQWAWASGFAAGQAA